MSSLKDKLNAKASSEEEARARRLDEMVKRNAAITRELPPAINALYRRVREAVQGADTLQIQEQEENHVGSVQFVTSRLSVSYRCKLRVVFVPDPFGGVNIAVPEGVRIPFSVLPLVLDESNPERWHLVARTGSTQSELTDDLLNSLLESALGI